MKTFTIFITILLISAKVFATDFEVDSSVFDKVEFISHEEPGQWTSYLVMNINFKPVQNLFKTLDTYLGGALNKESARSEAHITVITPVEFYKVLSSKITIQEIHDIAKSMKIQDSKFDILCLGKAEAEVNDSLEQTYYLVVESRRILDIRKAVFDLYKRRGGNVSQFDPNLFYPHITIGYTKDDLHLESHGVKKGANSCFANVAL